jgi:hypothetical protein
MLTVPAVVCGRPVVASRRSSQYTLCNQLADLIRLTRVSSGTTVTIVSVPEILTTLGNPQCLGKKYLEYSNLRNVLCVPAKWRRSTNGLASARRADSCSLSRTAHAKPFTRVRPRAKEYSFFQTPVPPYKSCASVQLFARPAPTCTERIGEPTGRATGVRSYRWVHLEQSASRVVEQAIEASARCSSPVQWHLCRRVAVGWSSD